MHTAESAQAFLGVAPLEFEHLASAHRLRRSVDGLFYADDIAGLAETTSPNTKTCSTPWLRSFQRNGFAHLAGLLSESEMSDLERWATGWLKHPHDNGMAVERVVDPAGNVVRINYLEQDEASSSLVQNLPLRDTARQILSDAALYRISIVHRSHEVPPELGRHRDPRWSARAHCAPIFAIGIHLDVCAGTSGDVYYVPGSHRLSCDGSLPEITDPELTEITPPTQRGDAIAHNLGVIHGAHRYAKPGERVTVYCSYASPLEANAGWPTQHESAAEPPISAAARNGSQPAKGSSPLGNQRAIRI